METVGRVAARAGAKERVRMATISTDVYAVYYYHSPSRGVGIHSGLSLAMTATLAFPTDSARLLRRIPSNPNETRNVSQLTIVVRIARERIFRTLQTRVGNTSIAFERGCST